MKDTTLQFPGLTACQVYQLLEMYRPDNIVTSVVPNALKSKGYLCLLKLKDTKVDMFLTVLQLAFEEKKNKFANELFF